MNQIRFAVLLCDDKGQLIRILWDDNDLDCQTMRTIADYAERDSCNHLENDRRKGLNKGDIQEALTEAIQDWISKK